MNRLALSWPVLLAVALAVVPGAGRAMPFQQAGIRLVVGYGSSGAVAARALERGLAAKPVAAIPQLDVDIVEVSPARADLVLRELRSTPIVRYAERDHLVRALRVPDDEFWPTQWSPRKTNAPAAWDLTTGSPQVVVAVVDTGVDPEQPDLGGKLVPGYDFVGGDADPSDDNGHGTAVAGIVAANSDNRIGVAGYCWQCRVMPVKVLGADGAGASSAVAQGIVWAVDGGASVINASLGGPAEDYDVGAAAQYAWAHGVLLVAAAGNDSSSLLEYPAALPNVLSVGASDQDDRLYDFSNSGASVAAPGENSTAARRGEYERFLGTSSAAPVVSGIAALALSAVPGASPAQVTQAIEQSAVPIPGVVYGRVDAYAALRALAVPLPPTQADGSPVRRPTVTRTFNGRLGPRPRSFPIRSGGGMLSITLVLAPAAREPVVLELRGAKRVVASARGRRRLGLRARIPQGRYRVVISATARRLSFKLTVNYQRAR